MPSVRDCAPLGREQQFADAVGRLRPGGGVVVCGPAGSGRTTLARALEQASQALGHAPLWIAPTEAIHDVPFGSLWCLGDDLLDRSRAVTASSHVSAMRRHGGAALTVLTVDDAHLLDEHSATVVLQAVANRSISIVATTNDLTAIPVALSRLIDDRNVGVVELSPFDRPAVAAVASRLLGGQPADSTTELLWQWSGGIPSVLHAIVETGRHDGRFSVINGQWWWRGEPPAPDTVTVRIDRLVADIRDSAVDALSMIALSEWIAVADIELAVGADALIELESNGLIVARDDGAGLVVRCADELIATTVVGRLAPLRRRTIARRVLDIVHAPRMAAEVARAARLYVHTGESTPANLMHDAAAVVRLSDPGLARQIAEVNHRWSPSLDSVLTMVSNHVESGETATARELLRHARRLAVDDDERSRVAEAEFAIRLFGDLDPEAAMQALHSDAARLADARSRNVASLESLAMLLSARPDEAERRARRAMTIDVTDEAQLRAGITVVASLMLAGRTTAARGQARALLDIATTAGTRIPSAAGMLQAELAFIDLWRGALTTPPRAHPRTGRWPAPPAVDGPRTSGAPDFRWALTAGIISHLRGDVADATVRLREAVVQQSGGKGIFHAEASAWLIVALCDGGSRVDASTALASFPERHLAVLPGLRHWAEGVLRCAEGDIATGGRLLGLAAHEAARVGAALCEARYLVEHAERCGSDEHIARLDELARHLDAPLLQLLCRTAVARLECDLDTLLDCAVTLAQSGLAAKATMVCRDVARISKEQGRPAVARRANQLQRRLIKAPATTDRHPQLTGRETEIATLAAGGLTDRQIAARFTVSVRTVESHLASAYRKLGVSSRVQLAPALI